MAQAPKAPMEKAEAPKFSKRFRDFKGIFTKSSRNAIPEDHFYDLVNIIPIGAANCHSVPDLSPALVNYGADTIYRIRYATINGIDYQYLFAQSGKVFQYNIETNVSTLINPITLLSGADTQMDQWQNQAILIADTTGYYSWDGTTFTGPITGGILPSAPLVAPDIAVYSNRVFLYSNRLLYLSDSTSGTYGSSSWLLANGALIQNLTDPQMRGQSVRLLPANGYLYIFFRSSITVISGLYVPSGASPPAPLFTLTNIQALLGSDQPDSIVPMDRTILFANKYGLYALSGTSVERLSGDIDGTIQYLNPAAAIFGGQCQVLGIPNASFLLNQLNDPVFGTRTIIANYFDQKWWFANYGTITCMAWGLYKDNPALFMMIGNTLYRAFDNLKSSPASSWEGPLWGMEDPVSTKDVQIAAVELTASAFGTASNASFQLSVDTENSSTVVEAQSQLGGITFVNDSGQDIQFVSNTLQPIFFFNASFQMYVADGIGGYGHYVGISGQAVAGTVYEMSGMYMDYYSRQRYT